MPYLELERNTDKGEAMFMKTDDIIKKLLEELDRAEKQHPEWPTDSVHAGAIVAEEAGELTRATLIHTYEQDNLYNMLEEAIQTGAMAIRFLKNFERYE
jgi:hypothetical protein